MPLRCAPLQVMTPSPVSGCAECRGKLKKSAIIKSMKTHYLAAVLVGLILSAPAYAAPKREVSPNATAGTSSENLDRQLTILLLPVQGMNSAAARNVLERQDLPLSTALYSPCRFTRTGNTITFQANVPFRLVKREETDSQLLVFTVQSISFPNASGGSVQELQFTLKDVQDAPQGQQQPAATAALLVARASRLSNGLLWIEKLEWNAEEEFFTARVRVGGLAARE